MITILIYWNVFPTVRTEHPPRTAGSSERAHRSQSSALLALALLCAPASASALSTDAEVYFSPLGGAQEAIVRELGRARRTVYVQAYSFSAAPIAKALLDASHRGVTPAAARAARPARQARAELAEDK